MQETLLEQPSTWKTELETFKNKGLSSLLKENDELRQCIDALQQQLMELEASNTKETEKAMMYRTILLEATQCYFKHLNDLIVLLESCKESEKLLGPINRNTRNDKVLKILNVCAGYEQVLDAIARDSDSDSYAKQAVAASTLVFLMHAAGPALVFGCLLGVLIHNQSIELPMQMFLGGLDTVMGLAIVMIFARVIQLMLYEKDILTTIINKYDSPNKTEIKVEEPLNDAAPFYNEVCEGVRDLRREIFGNFGSLFKERESAYSVAENMRAQLKLSLRN